jgi:hypothetical protein
VSTTDSDDRTAPPTRQVIQRASAKPESAGAKVTVYCKMPNGLRIRNFEMVSQREQVLGGGTRDFNIAQPVGEDILIWGNRFRIGDPQSHRIIGDHGVTEGVDKDSWEKWLSDNKDSALVRNGLVFAAEKRDFGEDEAHDRRDAWSGLGPMLKDGDPRAPRAGANLQAVKDYESAT